MALALATTLPSGSAAQATEIAAGAATGVVVGGYVALGIITAQARAGHYLFSPDDASWQLLPIPALGLAGGVLGYRRPDRVWPTVGWSAAGFAVGTAGGALLGRLVWGPGEGTWAGGVLGGSVGLLAGAVLAAQDDGDPPLTVTLARIEMPW